MFTLTNAIRLMILAGLLAVALTLVKACQAPEGALERFGVDSLTKLTVLDNPPLQSGATFQTPTGTMTLEDVRGKVVLVNVWATWCAPCVVEMPSLDELERMRGGEDFAVVPISLDRTMEEIETFYARMELSAIPIIHDPNYSVNAQLDLPGLPTSILYDRSGREVARLPGEAEWVSTEALALIDYLIAQ
ncbi:TlpA family protein disulfide reductase [Algimonas porphyrae]|uniref:Thioredoxin n=1 Tax=Algimonas porphyrae TaxID=1128113 RepID=A0ABQ5V421_9PROT|nr:TlpA disulfide reductase family protein [Algimonas porphyrae]GLQ21608.1 thioredoxin [Algimonas porphyrae]